MSLRRKIKRGSNNFKQVDTYISYSDEMRIMSQSLCKRINNRLKRSGQSLLKEDEACPLSNGAVLISSTLYKKITGKTIWPTRDVAVPYSFIQQYMVPMPTQTHAYTGDDAIEKLGTAEKAIAYADNGILLKRAGKYEDAIECYKKSLAADPKCGMTYYNLGKVLYLTQRYDEARRAYYLSYIYNSKNTLDNIYRHIGHAVIDTTEKIKINYQKEIMKYIDGISGKQVSSMESEQYLALCIKAGKEEIKKLDKEAAEKIAREV